MMPPMPREAPLDLCAPPDLGVLAVQDNELLGFTVWTECRPGLGEDAEPLMLYHRPSMAGLLGVLDGSGGSGSGSAWTDPAGVPHSGAWVGSRLARLGAESWFATQFEGTVESPRFTGPDDLAEQLRTVLRILPDPSRSKIQGDMLRRLPTTMALIRYHHLPQGLLWAQSLWAGDSRGYCLRPDQGLQPLTRDHTVETDALAQLTQDPPVTNVLCADRRFRVERHHLRMLLPVVLLCATDGFFGYLQTPADFERLLLDTLASADDPQHWGELLTAQVKGYTADDASLSLVCLGYRDFAQLRDSFAVRTEDVRRLLAGRPDPGRQQHLDWRQRMWDLYRSGYEAMMPPVSTEGSRR